MGEISWTVKIRVHKEPNERVNKGARWRSSVWRRIVRRGCCSFRCRVSFSRQDCCWNGRRQKGRTFCRRFVLSCEVIKEATETSSSWDLTLKKMWIDFLDREKIVICFRDQRTERHANREKVFVRLRTERKPLQSSRRRRRSKKISDWSRFRTKVQRRSTKTTTGRNESSTSMTNSRDNRLLNVKLSLIDRNDLINKKEEDELIKRGQIFSARFQLVQRSSSCSFVATIGWTEGFRNSTSFVSTSANKRK